MSCESTDILFIQHNTGVGKLIYYTYSKMSVKHGNLKLIQLCIFYSILTLLIQMHPLLYTVIKPEIYNSVHLFICLPQTY